MRMSMQAKFSPCERKFVCQHKMARDCEPVMQLVHHILHGGHEEDKLPKFNFQLAFNFLEGVSRVLRHNPDRHNPDRHNPDRDVTWTGHNPDRT